MQITAHPLYSKKLSGWLARPEGRASRT